MLTRPVLLYVDDDGEMELLADDLLQSGESNSDDSNHEPGEDTSDDDAEYELGSDISEQDVSD